MPSYTDVFGGANIYPSEISYSSLNLTADITLSWPEETSTNVNLATRIIDVTQASAGFSIILPDAKKVERATLSFLITEDHTLLLLKMQAVLKLVRLLLVNYGKFISLIILQSTEHGCYCNMVRQLLPPMLVH